MRFFVAEFILSLPKGPQNDILVEVKSYWLIDPLRQQAEFYRMGEDGRYSAVRLEDGDYRSEVLPGFWLRVAWLWEEQMPKVLDVVRELGVAGI